MGCERPLVLGFSLIALTVIVLGAFESFSMIEMLKHPMLQGSQVAKVTDEVLGELPVAVRDEVNKLRNENILLKSKIAMIDSGESSLHQDRILKLEERLQKLVEKQSKADQSIPTIPAVTKSVTTEVLAPTPSKLHTAQESSNEIPPANKETKVINEPEQPKSSPPRVLEQVKQKNPPLPQSKEVSTAVNEEDGSKTKEKCASWLKIYVYDFPEDLKFNKIAADYLADCRSANGKCDSQYGGENLLAQFSLELILADFFRQSCTRTMDPEEADLFYVPYYNDVEYRYDNRPNEASKFGQAILDIVEKRDVQGWEREFKVTGKYWKRKWGADHIITMSAPVTGLRHPKGTRGWGHYMLQLTPPIYLSVELTRSFIHEYPNCSSKNIVLPYPIPGGDWHNGVWRKKAEKLFTFDENAKLLGPVNPVKQLRDGDQATKPIPILKKPIFTYYSGGNHGCTNVRAAISKEVHEDPSCLGEQQRKELGKLFKDQNPNDRFDLIRGPPRQVAMAGSKFCACPEGDSPSAKRQYDAIVQGCIPAIVSNDAMYAYGIDMGGFLDPSDFSVRITEESVVDPVEPVGGLLKQLSRIPEAEVRRLQQGVYKAQYFYRYYKEVDGRVDGKKGWDPLVAGAFPDGGATEMLLMELERRADGKRAAACAIERKEPHHYLRFQFCGKANAEKEIAIMKRQRATKKAGSRDAIALDRGIEAYENGWISRRRRLQHVNNTF